MGIVTEARSKVKIGQRFERLVVLGRTFTTEHKKCRRYVVCQCECSMVLVVQEQNLVRGHTRSCGCLHRDVFTRHGSYGNGHRTRLYTIWQGMNSRCRSVRQGYYNRYGGRGIRVCDLWSEFEPFRDWSLEHGYANHLTIDRIDNDGDYCPENCRWATHGQQNRNKSSNRLLSAFGETKCLAEWISDSRNCVSRKGLQMRLKNGMCLEQALTTPSRNKKSRVG